MRFKENKKIWKIAGLWAFINLNAFILGGATTLALANILCAFVIVMHPSLFRNW